MTASTRKQFEGKVAFVTGGGTGIGLATVQAFAREGASVAVVGHEPRHVEAGVRLVEQEGGRGVAITCDVSNSDQVKAAVERTVNEFGRLDFAFNNAGVEQPVKPLDQISDDEFERLMEVDLRGVFLCMKHEIPPMLKNGGGVIVNTGSGASVKGIAGQAGYCAAKFGVIGLTKAAALDYAAKNIRVNAVCPGYVDTPMMQRFTGGTPEGWQKLLGNVPAGRAASADEIAGTVLWLCSDAAAYVIGQALVVDGGQTVL
jgi:NAD(P)-dependent dehydrogenase (short-subunit alcohol dehydrogenase family)